LYQSIITMSNGWDDDWGTEPMQQSPVQQPASQKAAPQWDDWGAGSKVTSDQSYVRGRSGRGRIQDSGNNSAAPGIAGWQPQSDRSSNWEPVTDSADWGGGGPVLKEARLNGDVLTIYIDSAETGRVIGRAGATIQDIQSKSGARVRVHRDACEGQTQIDITGSAEQRDRARALVEEKTGSRPFKIQKVDLEPQKEDFIDWAAAIRDSEAATKAKWAALPPLIKDFYNEAPEVRDMSADQVAEWRKNSFNLQITHFSADDDRKLPNPTIRFGHAFEKYPEIMAEIEKNKFETPTPIQSQSWPVLLSGIDLIGIAQTGTGKTLAYLLPAMIHIDAQTTPRSERPGPTALILAPVRELAQQIEREAQKYSYRGIRTICIYGGGDRKQQSDKVARGVEIMIATPGRLNDLCMSRVIDLSHVSYLVLDEADRMLDMGFEPQIRKILLDVRPDRQTVMMSATWPTGVRQMAVNYMTKPIQIFVNTLDLTACHTVTQKVHVIDQEKKMEFLENFINNMKENDKAIVFVGKKIVADAISSDLALKNYVAACMHGDRDQADREQSLDDLKTGAVRILIATDVASRGLDIDDITHIVNYDFPRNIEEYVHRIGRTGRAGRTGTSLSLLTRDDWKNAEELIRILKEAEQEVPEEVVQMAERYKVWLAKKKAEEEAYGITPRGGGGRRGGGGHRRDDDFSFGGGGGFGGRRSGPRW
jgi:ATP-dependent RNA helicase DDX43